MSDYTYFHSIYFQYAFGSGTLLFYLAVVNLSELRRELRVRAVPMLAAACLLFFGATVYQRSSVIERYHSAYNQEVYANFNEALSLIPKDAGVTATTFCVRHFPTGIFFMNCITLIKQQSTLRWICAQAVRILMWMII